MEAAVQAFALGLASAASPCLLPLYPSFLAYLAGSSPRLAGRRGAGLLGLVVLGGVVTAMLGVGLMLSVAALPVSTVLAYLVPVIDALLIVLGILLLTGRNPFERLPGVRVPLIRNPFGQAYMYGMMLGPIALPCAGPFIVVIFAISVGVGDAAPRVGAFLLFGLGFGLPLVILSLLAGARRQALIRTIVRHHLAILRVSGAILILAGIWDLRQNWGSILLTLGL